jgi:hypothetical protein
MRLINKHHYWIFSSELFENVNLQIRLFIFHVSPVLKVFSFYYYDSTVHYNSDFFVDKNLIQLPKFLFIRITFVTNSVNWRSTVVPEIPDR